MLKISRRFSALLTDLRNSIYNMKGIAKAVFTLTSFTLVERVCGFIFKIYLSRAIGAVGMGVYSVALSFVFVLLTLITSGIPLVVSRETAKCSGKDCTSRLCSAALVIEIIASVGMCVIVLALSKPLSMLFADPKSMPLVLIMLPSVVFTAVYSAFRGCLWGQKKFTAVSLVELIEQIARIIICVILFTVVSSSTEMVALSMSLSCFVSAVACVIFYFAYKGKMKSPKGEIKPLIKTSAPISFTRAFSSANNYIIALVVPFLLISAGASNEQSMYIFGSAVGMALPLLFLPITITGSLAFVLIPTLSQAYAAKDYKTLTRQIETAIAFSVIVALMCYPAYYVLGEPLGVFIYDNIDSGKFLQSAAWLLVPLSAENITSSMLNSLDLEKKSLINYAIGSVVMFAILFAFYGRFTIEVFTYAFGASLIISTVLDVIDIKRRTKIKLSFIKNICIAAIPIYPAIMLTQWVFELLPIPVFFAMAVAAITGLCFVLLFCIVFGAFDISLLSVKRRAKTKKAKPKTKKEKDQKARITS